MTDEVRMADDGCTNDVQYGVPTRVEFECAIEQFAACMIAYGKWKNSHRDEQAWQEILAAKADAERTIAVLLDHIPWGDA